MSLRTASHWRLLLATGALLPALSGLFSAPANAASVMDATVLHAAYLKYSPHLGTYNELQLVSAGTTLTVLDSTTYWLHVQLPSGQTGYITANHYYTSAPHYTTSSNYGNQNATSNSGSAAGTSGGSASSNSSSVNSGSQAPSGSASAGVIATPTYTSLPQGVRMDYSITPQAAMSDSYQQKLNAVLSVAQSKLGTPYIWGHNEDRGQYGFDCSNFVEYVFHHALGYLFSTSSRTQFYSVGTPVPLSQMRPGDLLFFSDNSNPTGTAHVGIYIGNGEMIQEGGGLAQVGYLSVSTGYWSNHLVAAHRLF